MLRKSSRHFNGRSPDDYIQAVPGAWLPENNDEADNGKLEQGGGMNGWDQFVANKTLFNVSSSYDEDLYTKKLDI